MRSVADEIRTIRWAFDRGDSRREDIRRIANVVAHLEQRLAELREDIANLHTAAQLGVSREVLAETIRRCAEDAPRETSPYADITPEARNP